MMITIRIILEALILACLACLSIHDIRCHKVTNRSLWCMTPLAAGGIALNLMEKSWYCLPDVVLGGVIGFGVMLGVSLLTHNGIGGGDIKLAGLLGLVCGIRGILLLLLAASFLGSVYGLIRSGKRKDGEIRLPFVPFMTAGFLFSTILSMI